MCWMHNSANQTLELLEMYIAVWILILLKLNKKKVGSLIQQSSIKFILMSQTRKLRLHFTFGYLSTLTQQISPKSNLNRRINSDFEKKYALGKNIKLWIKKDICCGSLKGLKEILWMHKIAYVFSAKTPLIRSFTTIIQRFLYLP